MTETTGNLRVYRSSAGSGKTYTLVLEFLNLLLRSSSPRRYKRILAMTFTNKAANEMKERVVDALLDLESNKGEERYNEFYLSEIAKVTDLSKKEVQLRSKATLKSILHNYSDLSISTIDKFVHKIIRTFARDLDIPFDFEVEMDETELLNRAIDMLINKVGTDKEITSLLVEFSERQADEESNWNIETDLLEKAKGLLKEDAQEFVEKLVKLSPEFFKKKVIELKKEITFFEKAISEPAQKALELIQLNQIDPSLFYYGKSGGVPSFFTKAAGLKKIAELFDSVSRTKASVEDGKWVSAKGKSVEQTVLGISEELKTAYYSIENHYDKNFKDYKLKLSIYKHIYSISVLNQLSGIVSKLKEDRGILAISDFNKRISEVVKDEPAPFIYERLGERYWNFLLDEFQDTSVLQWHNLLPLLENSLSEGNFNLIVGDGKQSIYRWRGGEVEQFQALPHVYGHQNEIGLLQKEAVLKQHFSLKHLDRNYRSYSKIVDFNNNLFQSIASELGKREEIYTDVQQEYRADRIGGAVEIQFLDHKKEEKTRSEAHLGYTIKKVKEALEANFSLSNICIIIRKNSEGIEIANALLKEEIPVLSNESLLIYSDSEVRFLFNCLKFLHNEEDNIASIQLIHFLVESGRIEKGWNDLFKNYGYKGEETRHLKPDVKAIFIGEKIRLNWEFAKTLPLTELLEYFIRSFQLSKEENNFILFFLDAMHSHSSGKSSTLSEVIQWWEGQKHKASLQVPESIDAVRIMTIHKSKGLQFPVVICPFSSWTSRLGVGTTWLEVDEDTTVYLPVQDLKGTSFNDLFEEEEEKSKLDDLNLLYVAFTRAEERLYISSDFLNSRSTTGKFLTSHVPILAQQEALTRSYDEEKLLFQMGEKKPYLKPGRIKHENGYLLSETIHTTYHKRIFIAKQAPEYWEVETPGEAQKFGNIVHVVLSKMVTQSNLEDVLKRMSLEGIASQSILKQVKDSINALFELQKMRDWFGEEVNAMVEMDLMDSKQQVIRPDRVVVKKEEIDLIDFKTGTSRKSDEKQINEYGILLKEMYQLPVKKYLVYTENAEIIEVE